MKGSSHITNVGPAADPAGPVATAATPLLLTVAELSARWGISGYTLRSWARAGRITDGKYEHGEWRFLHTARLRLAAAKRASGPNGDDSLVDLGAFPLTVTEVATHYRCTEATVRRRARAGEYAAAVHTPAGWRFGVALLDLSAPAAEAPCGSSGEAGTVHEGRDADPNAALRALTFDVRRLGVPAPGSLPRQASASGSDSRRRHRRGARSTYHR